MAKKTKAAVAKAMQTEMPEYKPTIQIDEKMLPDVKNLKIDQVVDLSLKVKITNISRQRWNNNQLCVTGEIQNAEPEDSGNEPDSDYDD